MNPLAKYIIPFAGLSQGIHQYDYFIDKDFFAELDYSLLTQSAVNVHLSLNKTETMLILDYELKGTVNLQCDRCTEYFDLPIEGKRRLFVKFGENTVEENDEVLILSEKEHEFDSTQYIYEFINLLVPMRHVHPDDENGNSTCNPEMLETIEKLTHKQPDPEEIDPRWEALKKLKNLN